MRVVMVALGLALTSTAALSQGGATPRPSVPSQEQTFRDIGRILQGSEHTVAPAQSVTGGPAPATVPSSQTTPTIAAGAELTASTLVTALTGPSPTAGIGLLLRREPQFAWRALRGGSCK
jgi:hypothetical protein